MGTIFFKANSEIRKIVGERIKKQRIEMGYSQVDLSRKTGVSVHSISNIENGSDFTFDNLISILRAFNMVDNIDSLIPEPASNPYDVAAGIKNRQRRKRKQKR